MKYLFLCMFVLQCIEYALTYCEVCIRGMGKSRTGWNPLKALLSWLLLYKISMHELLEFNETFTKSDLGIIIYRRGTGDKDCGDGLRTFAL